MVPWLFPRFPTRYPMTREMHRGKMQVILRDWDQDRVPDCKMSQEEEAELNAMDFVETEYKYESFEESKASKRKISEDEKSKSKKYWGHSIDKFNEIPRGTKAKNSKKKIHNTQKQPLARRSNVDSNFANVYPYAARLKSLCDKVNTYKESRSEHLPARLFNQLHHLEVHYPYAALLRELFLTAQANSTNDPSIRAGLVCQDQEVAKLLKTLHYQVEFKSECSKQSHSKSLDFETPYSAMLTSLVKQHKECNFKENRKDSCIKGSCDIDGIGKILHNSMAEEHTDDLPLSELHSSALLHKMSLSVLRSESFQAKGNQQYGCQRITEQSSTESSQSEVDDIDWHPIKCRKKLNKGLLNTTKKRKLERRKKQAQTNPGPSKLIGTFPSHISAVIKKEDREDTSDSIASSRLLQLIMGKDQKDLTSSIDELSARKLRFKTKENKLSLNKNYHQLEKSKVSSKKVHSKKKNRMQIKSEMAVSIEAENGDHEKGLLLVERQTKKKHADDSYFPMNHNPSEQQSLLKEYLLKPACEDIKIEETCDMPKVETHFLFSRMLQNFKILAEASNTDSITEKDQEAQSVPDILRGMLVSGNTEGELQTSAGRENRSVIQSALQQRNLLAEQAPTCRVKCDDSVICKLESEEIICKVEKEDEDFECQVCHLQFSSRMDLSNHQVLFHCTEDPQSSSSDVVLSHCVDNLSNPLLPEKLPA